jgi:putative flippase GtrA
MAALLLKIVDAWYQRTMLAKLFSFASIGALNTAIDLTAFTMAFQLANLPLVASNVISWAIAVTCSYAMNTKITFSQETGGALSIRRYLRFAASGIFGMVVATAVLVVLTRYVNIPTAKLGSVLVGFGVNFSMSHFLVFRSSKLNSVTAEL